MISRIIDFDDPSTFPTILGTWNDDFKKFILSNICLEGVTEGWQIEHQLQDFHIDAMPIVVDFVKNNPNAEVAVSHVTRLLEKSVVLTEGLVTGGGKDSIAEKRIRVLLEHIGLNEDRIEEILTHIYYYWDRDKSQRTECVHFMFDRKHIYMDDTANNFAINLGGEILRWAIDAIDDSLYQTEPFKRLWIEGTPCIVKFKCKLSDIHEIKRNGVVAEIVKYNIVTQMFGYTYDFGFTGMTNGSIPAEDIISIDEIEGFIEMQEKYPEFEDFYDELKKEK